jgi:hypothetical protein
VTGLSRLHTAKDIGEAVGRSERWVKEQAHAGRFPHVKVGKSYGFTAEHWAEIVALLSRQADAAPAAPKTTPRRRAPQKPRTSATEVVLLQPRPPRRLPKNDDGRPRTTPVGEHEASPCLTRFSQTR